MHAPEPAEMAASRCVYTVVNSALRQGRLSGTEETWSVVRAIWKGEEVVFWGERILVPRGVNSRGLLTMILRSDQIGNGRGVNIMAFTVYE
jgi:hypothetical protein